MKTILFTDNQTLIQKLENEGRQFILAKDPIKTLKAMKKIQKRGEYTILGDDTNSKYVEFAKKMGYREFEEPSKDKFFVETLTMLGEGYNKRLEGDLKRVEDDYKTKFELLQKEQEERLKMTEAQRKTTDEEYQKKITELDKEKDSIKQIKTKIRKTIYGQT